MADERKTFYESTRSLIETRVASLWVDSNGDPLTPIQWPGVIGIGGNAGGAEDFPPTNADWLRIAWELARGSAATVGAATSGLNRYPGIISLTVFTPSGVGEARLSALVGAAIPIFDRYPALYADASTPTKKLQQGGWAYCSVITPIELYVSIA